MSQEKLAKPAVTVLPNKPEKLSVKQHVARGLGKAAVAGAMLIPVVDFFGGDAMTVKMYEPVDRAVEISNPVGDFAAQQGTLFGIIGAQCLAVSALSVKSKKINKAFDSYDAYSEAQKAIEPTTTLGLAKKTAGRYANKPYDALRATGEWFEEKGNSVAQHESAVARFTGGLLVDTGKVNAMGPPFAAMTEAMSGNTPSVGRMARLSGLFAGTWIAGATAFEGASRIPYVGEVFKGMKWGFDHLTELSLDHPLSSPGTYTIGLFAGSLAYSAVKASNFAEQQELQELARLPDQLLPFPEASA